MYFARRHHSSFTRLCSLLTPIVATLGALVLGGLVLLAAALSAGCLAAPPQGDEREPAARIVAMWDPLACGEPQRIVVELEAESGARYSRSAPCAVGTVSIDVDHWGFFFARAYIWVAGVPRREEDDIARTLAVDEPITYWELALPGS